MKYTLLGIPLFVAAAAVGGSWFVGPGDESEEIAWGRPVHHEFGELDTVGSVAEAYGVEVAEILEWNGRTDFQPGDKILIWSSSGFPSGLTVSPIADISFKSALNELRAQFKDRGTERKKAPRGSKQDYIPVLVTEMTITGSTPAGSVTAGDASVEYQRDDRGSAEPVEADDNSRYLAALRSLKEKVDLSGPDTSRGSGSYGTGDHNDAVRDMFKNRDGATAAKADKWTAGHTNGNDAPEAAPQQRGATKAAVSGGSSGGMRPSMGALAMPRSKKCLAGPSEADLDSDKGMVSSAGLNEGQIRAAMNGFMPKALRCVQGAAPFNGVVETELTVGCDGRVSAASVESYSGVPADVASCIGDVLQYASFPAHDMPDGYTFGYRVHVSR